MSQPYVKTCIDRLEVNRKREALTFSIHSAKGMWADA
jgi:hypothetical protein